MISPLCSVNVLNVRGATEGGEFHVSVRSRLFHSFISAYNIESVVASRFSPSPSSFSFPDAYIKGRNTGWKVVIHNYIFIGVKKLKGRNVTVTLKRSPLLDSMNAYMNQVVSYSIS